MPLIPLICNQCGAPLEAADSAKFLTCGHCHARLRIVPTDSAFSTEILDELNHRTREISNELRLSRLQKELEKLEQEWRTWCDGNNAADLHRIADAELFYVPVGVRAGGYVAAATFLLMGLALNWAWILAAPLVVFVAYASAASQERRLRQFQESRHHHRDQIDALKAEISETRSALAVSA